MVGWMTKGKLKQQARIDRRRKREQAKAALARNDYQIGRLLKRLQTVTMGDPCRKI